jgi:hypothetical protein
MAQTGFVIWPPCEVFYIHSMLFNTQSAARSIEVLGTVMSYLAESETPDPLAAVDTEDVLNHLQNIVVQGAALSRYFWPVRKAHESRGEFLRQALGITDQNPLKSRELRNAMEHFDEKLDEYLASGIVGNVFPHYFGPLPKDDGVPRHIFRAYYVDVGQFEMLGNRYQIGPIANELLRLDEALTKYDREGGRF